MSRGPYRRRTTPQARLFPDRFAAERFIRRQEVPELFEVRQHPVRAKAFAVAQLYWPAEGGCILQGYVPETNVVDDNGRRI